MLYRRMVIAIVLALIIVLSSFPAGWADGPADYTPGVVHADGGDGHPWDDGTSEQTSPGDDPGDGVVTEKATLAEYPVSTPTLDHGFTGWVQTGLISAWKFLRDEFEQRNARKMFTRRNVK